MSSGTRTVEEGRGGLLVQLARTENMFARLRRIPQSMLRSHCFLKSVVKKVE